MYIRRIFISVHLCSFVLTKILFDKKFMNAIQKINLNSKHIKTDYISWEVYSQQKYSLAYIMSYMESRYDMCSPSPFRDGTAEFSWNIFFLFETLVQRLYVGRVILKIIGKTESNSLKFSVPYGFDNIGNKIFTFPCIFSVGKFVSMRLTC